MDYVDHIGLDYDIFCRCDLASPNWENGIIKKEKPKRVKGVEIHIGKLEQHER